MYFLNVLEDRRRDAIVPKIIRLATNQATEASTDGLMPRLMHVDFEGFETGPGHTHTTAPNTHKYTTWYMASEAHRSNHKLLEN